MNDVSEFERALPALLHELSEPVGLRQLSRFGIEQRAERIARARRTRAAIAGSVLVMATCLGGASLLFRSGDSSARIVTDKGGQLTPAAVPLGGVGAGDANGLVPVTSPTTEPPTASTTTTPTPLATTPSPATPVAPPVQMPQPTVDDTADAGKTAPAARGLPVPGEPSPATTGVTRRCSTAPAGGPASPPTTCF